MVACQATNSELRHFFEAARTERSVWRKHAVSLPKTDPAEKKPVQIDPSVSFQQAISHTLTLLCAAQTDGDVRAEHRQICPKNARPMADHEPLTDTSISGYGAGLSDLLFQAACEPCSRCSTAGVSVLPRGFRTFDAHPPYPVQPRTNPGPPSVLLFLCSGQFRVW